LGGGDNIEKCQQTKSKEKNKVRARRRKKQTNLKRGTQKT
jgi:hypothetical protein